jgi:mevalonate kinase
METTIFPSKILLFGEYTVLLGSKALAFPYPHFSGSLELFDKNTHAVEPDKLLSFGVLQSFYNYIRNTITNTGFAGSFRLEQMEAEITSGIFFSSNIPHGYGLGSSGALTAAIYHRYANITDTGAVDLSTLRKMLGYLESFFHQSSSGIDPLVSFCKKPLLVHQEDITAVQLPKVISTHCTAVLLDTHTKRHTGNLVQNFLQECEDTTYRKRIHHELIAANNSCIDAIVEGNTENLFRYLEHLSEFQYNYFKAMIPAALLPSWKKGLDTGEYYLKLCGAGGGGYLLAFSRDASLFLGREAFTRTSSALFTTDPSF